KNKDAFFQNWTHQIFKIIGIDGKGPIPIPAFFKETAWSVIENQLIPSMLKMMFEEGRKPSNLNKILVGVLQDSVDSAKTGEDSFLARFFPDDDELNERLEEPRFTDRFQAKLELK